MKQKNKGKPISTEQIKKAYRTLLSYRDAKQTLDKRIVENEEWFRLRCCGNKTPDQELQQNSAWLFNSILNKHADAMDCYPEPNVLPREQSDCEDAKQLSQILPVILEQRGFEQTYSDVWWYKLKTGTGIYGVFWNNSLEGGLGDIDIKQLDILNLFWEPNIKNIEQSKNLFYVQSVDKETFLNEYSFAAQDLLSEDEVLESYNRDDGMCDHDKILVIDWYYKVKQGAKTVLHYCKFAGNTILFASENEPEYRTRGFYDHGKYPVVFDTLFVTETGPAGFGYIDIMKGCQRSIDRLDAAVIKNVMLAETPRWFISDAAGINEEEYADWSKPFVHTTGRIDDETLKQISVDGINSMALSLLRYKVDELKETSGNRDFSQGGTSSGVTAASAIIALQEAAGKLSRDMVKSSFRAYSKICYIMVELIRQFYTEPRAFRITKQGAKDKFIIYKGNRLLPKSNSSPLFRRPIFDIKIVPQKQNPYQKAQQNELAKELFSLGMLTPQRKKEALIALQIMDFDGKDAVIKQLNQL